MIRLLTALLSSILATASLPAQEAHDHPAPEKLGKVSFPIHCAADAQEPFNRGVALLHSFAYAAAREAFGSVAKGDPACAMAHWGAAMTYYHPLWEPPLPAGAVSLGRSEVEAGLRAHPTSDRERRFLEALAVVFNDPAVPYSARALKYELKMKALALEDQNDVEPQVFYALALLANASPADKTHARQKQALELLEPLYRAYPDHPGIPHYLIHACDNAELAVRGLAPARAYAQIAPSAPHALHMPSHIFTRLGLWDESIASNDAARAAAHRTGDIGEELHAMDYLVYAYLQIGRDSDAQAVIRELDAMPGLNLGDFKVAYARTAMPSRLVVERNRWADAANIATPADAPLQVTAIAVWCRGLGLARSGQVSQADKEAKEIAGIEKRLRASGNDYWATQTAILAGEVAAWITEAGGRHDEAEAQMRAAADAEDSLEKLPVTPGPILPAREQLAYLLLQRNQPARALKELETALQNAPGRRTAMQGKVLALELQAQ